MFFVSGWCVFSRYCSYCTVLITQLIMRLFLCFDASRCVVCCVSATYDGGGAWTLPCSSAPASVSTSSHLSGAAVIYLPSEWGRNHDHQHTNTLVYRDGLTHWHIKDICGFFPPLFFLFLRAFTLTYVSACLLLVSFSGVSFCLCVFLKKKPKRSMRIFLFIIPSDCAPKLKEPYRRLLCCPPAPTLLICI